MPEVWRIRLYVFGHPEDWEHAPCRHRLGVSGKAQRKAKSKARNVWWEFILCAPPPWKLPESSSDLLPEESGTTFTVLMRYDDKCWNRKVSSWRHEMVLPLLNMIYHISQRNDQNIRHRRLWSAVGLRILVDEHQAFKCLSNLSCLSCFQAFADTFFCILLNAGEIKARYRSRADARSGADISYSKNR